MLIQKNSQVSISFVAVKRPEVTNCHRGNKTEFKHVQAESMLICPLSWCSLTWFCSFFQEMVRLRYKLTFDLGEESHDESGDVEQFPPPDTWGNL